ncbi:MAG: CocE/NonD family hydrolase [Candidatus Lokiarchaeota archaeon]|nr:CocE/NonD family hydrolase [Candidatus Lokiarchaeota archaeon]
MIFDRLCEDIGKYRRILPFKVQSTYIPLKNEEKILLAADIITEKGSLIERPTFLRIGHRWREKEDIKQYNPLIQEGFNFVKVDVRGTGSSFGNREIPWSPSEIQEINDIVHWITEQPWSDGKVILIGSDYSATVSELAVTCNNNSIYAYISIGNGFNLYSDVMYPGGLFLESYVKKWSEKNKLYENTKIKPLNDPLYHSNASIIKDQHTMNKDVMDLFSSIEFSDQLLAETNIPLTTICISAHSDEIYRNKFPKFSVGSWFDAKTANSVIHRFLNYSKPFIGVIGCWKQDANPLNLLKDPESRLKSTNLLLLLEFIRFARKSITNPTSIPKLLYYYTNRENKWKVTNTWPLPNQVIMPLYLAGKNQLNMRISSKAEKSIYKVNYSTTTGTANRWQAPFGDKISYKKRAKQDKKCLIFTSQALSESIEITGHPMITLHFSSTHKDGAIFVYLEVIYQKHVYYLSEGQLRLILWKESSNPYYKTPIPYRSFGKNDVSFLQPNSIYNIRIPLEPISVLLPEKSKIRIAIAGADAGNFKLYPEPMKPPPEWNIYHNTEFPSLLELPVIPRDNIKK